MATGMLINALVETFFMPNCANFSELIRTGNLDFALLKPIDTQFLVSFEKVEIAMLGQVGLALALLGYSLTELDLWPTLLTGPGLVRVALYVVLIACGAAFFYSLMIVLAATSVWFGRNQGLYDFWFYVTVFARYPREIYTGQSFAAAFVSETFTYVIPILLVVTLPARVLVKAVESWQFVAISLAAAATGLIASRLVFQWSLRGYRSASS
jgi:ABC-2 type transport system permease protein